MTLFGSSAALVAAHPVAFILLLLTILGWLLAEKRLLAGLARTSQPVLPALIDLLLLPLLVVLLAGVGQRFLGRFPVIRSGSWLPAFSLFVFCITVGWCAARVVHAVLLRSFAGERRDRPVAVPGLLRGVVYGVCLLLSGIVFVLLRGYSLTGVWVSTGLATAVLGFALQQTLGDFFSGVALSLEGAFRIGDWLEFDDGTTGQVVDVNWRATWLRDWNNSTHVVPNAKLAAKPFTNLHGDRHFYRPWYFVKVPAEVDPRFVKELLLEAVFRCKHVVKEPAPVVRLADGSTQPYTYMVWVGFANYPAMFRGREELFREIHYALKRAGVVPAPEVHEWRSRRAEIPTAEPPTLQLALKSLDLFSHLHDDEIVRIAQASQQINYDAEAKIVLEGDTNDALDIITSGVVESRVKTAVGGKVPAGQLVAGQYFGLVSMLTGQPSLFEYTARTDVTLIRVNVDCMRDVLKRYPDLADFYAGIVKQRLDEVELLGARKVAHPARSTSQQVKELIRKWIA